MKQYNVIGMSCAACSARVEKAVNSVPGVDKCAVSLLTNSMGVEGSASEQAVVEAVKKAGYDASPKGMRGQGDNDDQSLLEDRETPMLKRRLIASLIFLIILMYISMGHMMFGWPMLSMLEDNHMAIAIIQMVLTIAIMIINKKFFVSGFGSVLHGAPNMDTLVALGSGTAFAYSVYETIQMYLASEAGNMHSVMAYMDGLYYESAAMILTLITVGKMLEANSKGSTTNALKALIRLSPQKATLLINEEEVQVPIEQVAIGDIFVVKPGENIPVDGIVTEGISAVNEAALTGESIPVDKCLGDVVSAATNNTSGHLICRASRVGEDTTLSQIIKLVSDAAATKAPIARIADKVSGVFVPIVIGIAIVVLVIWLVCGATPAEAINFAIDVLVISCPCALGLATPVAIMVGHGMGAGRGILFKTAESLEIAGKASTVVLDKTGTITEGRPVVTDVIVYNGNKDNLLQLAYSLESKSEHPLGKAVVEYARENHIRTKKVQDFATLTGNGLVGTIDGEPVCGGNLNFIESQIDVPEDMKEQVWQLANDGKTPMLFAKGVELAGIIAVADQVKKDSVKAINQLKALGIKVTMLTGDNSRTAAAVGQKIGVDTIIAGVLPADKERTVIKLKEDGQVIMVGDGINDAPALTSADVGIAIGAGTDVAIDAADIVLMNSSLIDVAAVIRLSRATLRNIHENLFWAFIYNIIGIPVAAGALMALFGISLTPMIAAACMSLSSFCVVANALRLNAFNMDKVMDNGEALSGEDSEPEIIDLLEGRNIKMKKTMRIEGMMCQHCEARVKQTLEGMKQVDVAAVSHEADEAVVTLKEDVADEVLKTAVEEQGYKVIEIK